MKALLIHGWRGWSTYAWFPWLKRELETLGYSVDVPDLPDPLFPRRDRWVEMIREKLSTPDTIVIAHSLGCAATLMALEGYGGQPLRGVVFVAGFGRNFGAPGLEYWFDHALPFEELRHRARNWSVLHSENDRWVPYPEGQWLAGQLHTEITKLPPLGHLSHPEGVFEAPPVLEAVLKMPRV
jgi:predicted alpha/beta hydrolase family esterase